MTDTTIPAEKAAIRSGKIALRRRIGEAEARAAADSAADHAITIPRTMDMLTPILASVPLQLLA